MFNLNPFHLEDASLLHFLMFQGIAVLAYLIYRERFRRQLMQLNETYRQLMAEDEDQQVLEPEVEEVFMTAPGRNDLKEIAGINEKVESILNSVGIHTFTQLANTPVKTIRRVLAEHGPLIYTDDPVTWPKQAWLAAEGRWDELRQGQELMRKGIYTAFQPSILL